MAYDCESIFYSIIFLFIEILRSPIFYCAIFHTPWEKSKIRLSAEVKGEFIKLDDQRVLGSSVRLTSHLDTLGSVGLVSVLLVGGQSRVQLLKPSSPGTPVRRAGWLPQREPEPLDFSSWMLDACKVLFLNEKVIAV